MAKKKEPTTPEQRLQEALVPEGEWPYQVPENWCWTYWGKCGTFTAGNGFKKECQGYENYSIPFYKVGSLKYSDDKGVLYDRSNTINDEIRSKLKATLIPENSLIFAKIGEAIRLNRRSINSVPCCIDNNLMSFHADVCMMRYAYLWSLELDLYDYANATTVPAIRKSDLEMVPFPLPPIPEQQRIVNRIESLFARLDEAKEKAQAALDSFEPRKAAILHKAFTGELTAKWREEHGVGMESWSTVFAMDVCEKIVCGKTPKEYIKPSGEIPYLKVYNIVNNQINFTSTPQFIPRSINDTKLKSSILKPRDVIMNIVGPPLRKIAIIPETYPEWNMNQAIVRFRPKSILNFKYLYYSLINPETLDDVIASTKGVVGQANISVTQSRNLQFNLPNMAEQLEIVRILDSLLTKEQQAKEAAEAVLEQIDLVKKSILSRAFRGDLGTNDPTEESAVELLKEILEK